MMLTTNKGIFGEQLRCGKTYILVESFRGFRGSMGRGSEPMANDTIFLTCYLSENSLRITK